MVKFSQYPAPLKWGAGLLGAGIALRLLYPVVHLAISGILYILLTIWTFFEALFHSKVDPYYIFTFIYVFLVGGFILSVSLEDNKAKFFFAAILVTILCNIGFYHQ